MGQVQPVRTWMVSAQNWLAAALWATLAVLAWRRSRAALWTALALIPLKLLGWAQALLAAGALPDMPTAMIAIWATYRLSMILLLAGVAGYLWRLSRKDRLA